MSSSREQGPPAKTTAKVDLQAVRALAEPLAFAHGVELVDIEWTSSPAGKVLRVTIERPASSVSEMGASEMAASEMRPGVDAPGGVTLDDCVRVSRDLSTALDVEDSVIAPAYSLEVSSPGLDRPLKTAPDYRRQLGKLAKLKLIEPAADGQTVLRGTIMAVSDEVVELEVDGNRCQAKLDNIRQAKLVFELGSASRGRGPKKGRKSSKRKSKGGKRRSRDPQPTEKRNEQSR